MHSLTEAVFRRSACYFLSSHDAPVQQLTDDGDVALVDTLLNVTQYQVLYCLLHAYLQQMCFGVLAVCAAFLMCHVCFTPQIQLSILAHGWSRLT